MGLYARYPIALAPGMGQNAFFVSVIMTLTAAGRANGWQTALGIVFVSGLAFVALSRVGIRNMILNALSVSLCNSIAVGIGLFIALIGLKNSGIIVAHPATFIQLNPAGPLTIDWAVFWLGFLVTAMLLIRGVPGAILWGILCATALAALGGQLQKPATYLDLPRENVFFKKNRPGGSFVTRMPAVCLVVSVHGRLRHHGHLDWCDRTSRIGPTGKTQTGS